jgi:hypothetical protein
MTPVQNFYTTSLIVKEGTTEERELRSEENYSLFAM